MGLLRALMGNREAIEAKNMSTREKRKNKKKKRKKQ